jgi:hypothetical protein
MAVGVLAKFKTFLAENKAKPSFIDQTQFGRMIDLSLFAELSDLPVFVIS